LTKKLALKKIIYYIFLIFLYIGCSSTKDRLTSADSNIKSIIENKQLNILYRGLKNYLTIYVPKSDSIKVSGVGVQKESENNYSITPTIGSSLEITITGFFKGKEVIDKRKFRIFNIRNPFASINGKTGEITLSKEELANFKVEYFIPQLVIQSAKVGKFQYRINEEKPMINYGEEFNEVPRKKIFEMKSGDSMIIDELNFNPELLTVDIKEVTKLKVFIK